MTFSPELWHFRKGVSMRLPGKYLKLTDGTWNVPFMEGNPAPPGMYKAEYIVGYWSYQLVQEFFYQQYSTHLEDGLFFVIVLQRCKGCFLLKALVATCNNINKPHCLKQAVQQTVWIPTIYLLFYTCMLNQLKPHIAMVQHFGRQKQQCLRNFVLVNATW